MGRDKDIPGYYCSGKIRVASRRCTAVPVAPPGGDKITDYRFLRFFVSYGPLFRPLMLTPMYNHLSKDSDFFSKIGNIEIC